ncbi:uncharacterized protein [Mytilus edulis]|uniref:uncharacterized protein isoform X1 n=2 Tax=Mytilus edulis TaxID=6550 RepID=UPI0039EF8772
MIYSVLKMTAENHQRSLASISNERSLLFGRPNEQRQKKRKGKKPLKKWTGTFVCLASRNQTTIPIGEEKMVLLRCGLGSHRVTMDLYSSQEEFFNCLEKEFPQLKKSGGFELLRCAQNCRNLKVLECNWKPESIRQYIGQQAKIYLRPIQNDLETSPSTPEPNDDTYSVICEFCDNKMNIRMLRDHLKICSARPNSESDELPDPELSPRHSSTTEPSTSATSQSQTLASITPDLQSTSNDNMTEQPQVVEVLEPISSGETDGEQENTVTGTTNMDDIITSIVSECVSHCTETGIKDPVDILRFFQSKMVYGRDLDIQDESSIIEGETNFILVDRSDILQSAFEDIEAITDLRLTLEVQFLGEIAVDLGGPRKEFFALILREIKEKYFSPLREWSPDYTVIGKIFALSFLQNGPLPKLLSVEQLEELFESSTPRPVIQDLRNGLNALGLLQLVKELPSLVHLFTPGSRPFNLKMITTLFKPVFAPEGSNRQIRQLRIYKKFVKYLKEVAAGRRGNLTLRHILMFATSSEEEPILGFTLQPSLNFVQRESFMPTANTCINRLFLTEPEGNRELPSDKLLSNLFDFAFSNTYYGLS